MARWNDEDKATALAALDANGGNVSKTARDFGVPRVTLIEWRDGRVSAGVSETRQVKKKALAETLEELAYRLADALPDKIARASLKDTATSLGIAVDKMQLLKGKPTAINEDVTLTDEERTERVNTLLDRARARRDGSAPGVTN